MKARFLICLMPAIFVVATWARAEIPPQPAPEAFFHDLAGVIGDGDEEEIRRFQDAAFDEAGAPVVVVTVKSMRDFDPASPSIESFARRWFDTWGIGSQEKNDGVLVIISTGDRKGRIELGADWGRRFDGYAKRIMDNEMVPHFKSGDYGEGLIAALEKLSAMAIAGPGADPPQPGITERLVNNPGNSSNPIAKKFGPGILILMIVAGMACFVAAWFFPQYRKLLIITGIVMIALAVLFWIVVAILFIWGKATETITGRGGGGGFSGGSSGGGGASGSW